jgi:hypothetical protein
MIYLESYFDDCNGLIPQIVLSAMALQAGNIRANVYKNALTVDLSAANTFSFDGYFLTLEGILPLTESRYLLTVPSLISRIGAMNSENLLVLSDTLGLPVDGFDPRPNLEPVQLPPRIENLSTGVLVLEKRLAYLLLLQSKRNNLRTLYNYLYYTRLAGEIERFINTKTGILGVRVSGNSVQEYIAGWEYKYIQIYPLRRSASITKVCIDNLFQTYPSLKRLLPDTAIYLESISDWLRVEMSNDNPVTLPNLDFDLLVGNIAEKIADLRYQEPPHDPLGSVLNDDNFGDVSSEISGGGGDASSPVGLPNDPYSSQGSDSPLVDRPSQNYGSPANNSPTTDPLPGC